MTARTRADLATATRIVVKVGSSSISGESSWRIPVIVEALAAAHARAADVVLASSGASASGIPLLRLDARPTDLATQQAAAAVGQNILVYRYQEALRPFDIVAGQVLPTTGDLENPTSRSNARRAMERLLGLRTRPIVNEKDTVATQEIRPRGPGHRGRRPRPAQRYRIALHAPTERPRRRADRCRRPRR